jgi:F0F1-type ATP synthase assembly protein I
MQKLTDYANYASLALSFGILMAGSLFFAYLAGNWLDRRFNTAPLFLAMGMALGAVYSLYAIVDRLRYYSRQSEQQGAKKPDTPKDQKQEPES